MEVFNIYIGDYRISVTGKSKEELDRDIQEFLDIEQKKKLENATIYNFDDYTIINFPEDDAKRIYEVLKKNKAKPVFIELQSNKDAIVSPKDSMNLIELDEICETLNMEFKDRGYFFGMFPYAREIVKQLLDFLVKKGWEVVSYFDYELDYYGLVLHFL